MTNDPQGVRVVKLDEIHRELPFIDVMAAMEQGFVAYSAGKAVVPPVGELLFEKPPGEVHIKYGYIQGGEHFVIKVASGFADNPSLGLPSNNGLMMLFKRTTGELSALLLDEGHLTDVRTAAAGPSRRSTWRRAASRESGSWERVCRLICSSSC